MGSLKDKIANIGIGLFLKELLSNPCAIGAPIPSSKQLARAIAKQVPTKQAGYVIELGAGTGVITQALLEHRVTEENIIVIERSASLVEHLCERFPKLSIIHGDAQHLLDLIGDKTTEITAVVSSLPLRSLPEDIVHNIGKQLGTLLQPNIPFIQFTYSPRKTYPGLPTQLKRTSSSTVWCNVPPARVDVFYNEPES